MRYNEGRSMIMFIVSRMCHDDQFHEDMVSDDTKELEFLNTCDAKKNGAINNQGALGGSEGRGFRLC